MAGNEGMGYDNNTNTNTTNRNAGQMIKMLRTLLRALPAGLTVVLAAGLLSACSTWPFHSEMPPASADGTTVAADGSTPPPLAPDRGRVYFFRMSSYSPELLIRPEIRMDGKIVGLAKPGSYFVVDLPTGVYSAAPTWNMDRSLNVFVMAGRTSYVRVDIRFPVLAGRVSLSEVSPGTGANMIATLDYQGGSGK